ncbi:MAG: hypothetical protein HWN66_19645 [Candidatus Helarchaeota archaeon]|nr:hypothetical protein [Candidatus Helarchaeota archaeon]
MATEKRVPQTLQGFKREDRHNYKYVRRKLVLETARKEVSRILNCLNLPLSLKPIIIETFTNIHATLHPGTKYRVPEKLVPLTTFFILKQQKISFNEADLLEIALLSKKEFEAFKHQILDFNPQYQKQTRKKYVLHKILAFAEHFKLGMIFFYRSKLLLYELWDDAKEIDDDIIAGLVASISVIKESESNINLSQICKWFEIKEIVLRNMLEKKIIKKLSLSKGKLENP